MLTIPLRQLLPNSLKLSIIIWELRKLWRPSKNGRLQGLWIFGAFWTVFGHGDHLHPRELIMRKKRSGAIKMLKKENPIQLARRYGRRWRGRVRDKLHPDKGSQISKAMSPSFDFTDRLGWSLTKKRDYKWIKLKPKWDRNFVQWNSWVSGMM